MSPRWMVAAVVLTGCTAASAPLDSAPIDVDFIFSKRSPHEGAQLAPTVEVTPALGRIRVAGIIPTPTPCHTLTAAATRHASTLVLDVTATQVGLACFDVIENFRYDAVILDVPAGRYQVVVNHAVPNHAEQAGAATVDVP